MRRSYARDLTERVLATYFESCLGLWIASGLGVEFITDLSSADKALVAVLPTLLAVVKGVVAKGVGSSDSASLADVPAPTYPQDKHHAV